MGLKTLVVDSFERTRLQYSNKNRVEQIFKLKIKFIKIKILCSGCSWGKMGCSLNIFYILYKENYFCRC